ncbi:MAG: hypothetical protein IPO92_19870 [Saprospiraceae bacterium]|nr:hypothetical protein [Saprospiraceae bacterium]
MQDTGSVYGRRPITGRFVRTVEETWNFVFSNGDTIGSTQKSPVLFRRPRHTFQLEKSR